MRDGFAVPPNRFRCHGFIISLALCILVGRVVGDADNGSQHGTGSTGTSSSAIDSLSISHQSSVAAITNSVPSTSVLTSTRSATTPATVVIPLIIYSSSRSTCPSRTINYITHTLPQQCLKANWTGAGNYTGALKTRDGGVVAHANIKPLVNAANDTEVEAQSESGQPGSGNGIDAGSIQATGVGREAPASSSIVMEATVSDADTDSPLDNVNFLSFEEWKKQNLARMDKSKENLGSVPERQGGIKNALESMSDGEEFDLSLGFGGGDPNTAPSRSGTDQAKKPSAKNDKATPSERPRKKDAGTTCKERFNYASTDCAATILKTNPKSKSASSVLKENKDSYMLNECSINNKFLIVELCDDILVDTVVLANFEFFSSMFRTFRVSVSDRYPVEMDRWKDLGTFEAKNAREIQAFAIHNPLIWARYLRVEFLNHYGAEYYCPVSLLRIHGTTMLDELRNPEEPTKADEVQAAAAIPSASPVAAVESAIVGAEAEKTASSEQILPVENASQAVQSTSPGPSDNPSISPSDHATIEADDAVSASGVATMATPFPFVEPLLSMGLADQLEKERSNKAGSKASVKPESVKISQSPPSGSTAVPVPDQSAGLAPRSPPAAQVSVPTASSSVLASVKIPASAAPGGSQNAKVHIPSQEASKPVANVVQPPTPSPTTQESFFKTFHKRLQVLETNATLSLQYIEEQSRILRDAFTKVEKRQKTKVDDFVLHLNTTVMAELKSFRQQYDQLWQSTIIELESHRDQYQREILAVSTRLSMLAEELVWQKRMALVQTTLLVICLALFIFVRSSGGSGGHLELPIMQQWLNKSHSMLGFPFDSPGPEAKSGRRLMRIRSVDDLDEDSDENNLLNSPSPTPSATGKRLGTVDDDSDYGVTPTKRFGAKYIDSVEGTPSLPASSVAPRLKAMLGQSRSGPATPRGTREPNTPMSLLWAAERMLESSPLSRSLHTTVVDENNDGEEEDVSDNGTHDISIDSEHTLVNEKHIVDTAAGSRPGVAFGEDGGRVLSPASDSAG